MIVPVFPVRNFGMCVVTRACRFQKAARALADKMERRKQRALDEVKEVIGEVRSVFALQKLNGHMVKACSVIKDLRATCDARTTCDANCMNLNMCLQVRTDQFSTSRSLQKQGSIGHTHLSFCFLFLISYFQRCSFRIPTRSCVFPAVEFMYWCVSNSDGLFSQGLQVGCRFGRQRRSHQAHDGSLG